jgi:hypothetical protein
LIRSDIFAILIETKILYTTIMAFSLLKFKPLEAPHHYLFKDPDTGRMFQARKKDDLVKQIVAYRAQNEFEPLEYLGVVIDAYMCSLPEFRYKCEPADTFSRGVFGYISGGIALLKNMFYGERNMVNQRVADARASQCMFCKFNVFPDKGAFLRWSDEVAEASTHGRKSLYYNKLGNCQVCSCPLKAKVWYKGTDEKHSEEEIEKFKQVDCWQIKGR